MNIAYLKKNNRGNVLLSVMMFLFFLFFSLGLVLIDHYQVQTFYIHATVYYQANTMRTLAKADLLDCYEHGSLPNEGSYYFEEGQVNFQVKGNENDRWVELKIQLKNKAVFGEIEKIELKGKKSHQNS